MIEIGIGVLFALIFVTAYLLVSRLLGKGGRFREIAEQPFGSKAVKSKQPRLFLTAAEMREHHSKARNNQGK